MFFFFFLILVILARSKALICTRKRNPEDSGRTSKMVSSCQWPFSSFLLASSLLNSSFYFNHSGTLQSSAVVSYDIIINIDKKLNLFALRQKIGFGLCKKLENFVITKTLKIPTAFCQATKSSVRFILTAILRWVILFRERYQLTLLVTLKTCVSHLRTGFQK